MKKWMAIAAAVGVSLSLCAPVRGVETSAASAILVEAESGRVLYEHNADDRRLIASTTKLMTALVALESGHGLDEEVVIEEADTRTEGSSLYLRVGETISLETLLYGLLLHSGNDAALAVARYCGGSVEDFVAEMNAKAAELGMTDSRFANPNGLNDEQHYSTARDMARLARACMDNETLSEIVSTKSTAMGGRVFQNHNKLLWQYEGCVGMKTGYTELAGRTLVSAARRDDMTLIAVTLNDPNDWADHKAMYDYGFANYHMETAVQAGEALCTLPVSGGLAPFAPLLAGETVMWPVTEGETLTVSLRPGVDVLNAPVEPGTQVGEAVCLLNGETVSSVPLICTGAERVAAEKQSPIERLLAWILRK